MVAQGSKKLEPVHFKCKARNNICKPEELL